MSSLPYVSSPGSIDRALNGIKEAAVPERVSQDFVKTILKIAGGAGNEMTSFLKKLGLTSSDGSPSDRYRKFRNPTFSGLAIASAMKDAYAPLYIRNEYAHKLSDAKLMGLIVEETGQAHDSRVARYVASCFKHLNGFADFDATENAPGTEEVNTVAEYTSELDRSSSLPLQTHPHTKEKLGLNLGYTINLNLPATADPAVFDAIFRSLKEHLLSDSDV